MSNPSNVRVRIRGSEMLVFRNILRKYQMNDPQNEILRIWTQLYTHWLRFFLTLPSKNCFWIKTFLTPAAVWPKYFVGSTNFMPLVSSYTPLTLSRGIERDQYHELGEHAKAWYPLTLYRPTYWSWADNHNYSLLTSVLHQTSNHLLPNLKVLTSSITRSSKQFYSGAYWLAHIDINPLHQDRPLFSWGFPLANHSFHLSPLLQFLILRKL